MYVPIPVPVRVCLYLSVPMCTIILTITLSLYILADKCTTADGNKIKPYLTTKYQVYKTTAYTLTKSYHTTWYYRHTTSKRQQAVTSSTPLVATTTRTPSRDTSSSTDRARTTPRITESSMPSVICSGSKSGYTLDEYALKFRLSPRTPSVRSKHVPDILLPGIATTSPGDNNKRTERPIRRTTVTCHESRTRSPGSFWPYPATPRRWLTINLLANDT